MAEYSIAFTTRIDVELEEESQLSNIHQLLMRAVEYGPDCDVHINSIVELTITDINQYPDEE